jgi:transcriptional regulator with XRE-family HTH domain
VAPSGACAVITAAALRAGSGTFVGMDPSELFWREHLKRLGEYIKAQRQFSQLSQRELARLADLSDTYMSQLERGLHEPSIRVVRSLADSLGIRPDQLLMYAAGLPVDESAADVRTEAAIRRDDRFSEAQKRALLAVVRSYLDEGKQDDVNQ